uniref:Uncharacterized protein n=1 Tax=Timema poppense TaxID=170557 RepID=A0A7R9DJT8_TIMPO|nr:unnamed protein product [Timema poppensis]
MMSISKFETEQTTTDDVTKLPIGLCCRSSHNDEKCNMAMVASNMSGHIQSRLTRSLERILEEAHLSGELKLTGRKLKDFPKSGGKYDLGDTVFAAVNCQSAPKKPWVYCINKAALKPVPHYSRKRTNVRLHSSLNSVVDLTHFSRLSTPNIRRLLVRNGPRK